MSHIETADDWAESRPQLRGVADLSTARPKCDEPLHPSSPSIFSFPLVQKPSSDTLQPVRRRRTEERRSKSSSSVARTPHLPRTAERHTRIETARRHPDERPGSGNATATWLSITLHALTTYTSPPSSFMMIDTQRRRILRALNRRWIYGQVPLLHALVFFFELAMVSILIRKFNAYYAARPVLTTMVTNAILGGIADTVAQSLTAIRQRAVRKPSGPDSDDILAIEIHDLDRKGFEQELIPDSPRLPPPFDFERLTRFMAYGFLMAPLQHKWFSFLSRTFPITKASGTVPVLKRVAFDQLIFAPCGLGVFFTFMTVAEGGGRTAVLRKFQDVYMPALKANYMVWPAVQILNFRVMPLQFQIPLVSTVGIAWTAYLSLTNASEADQME